MIDQLVVGASPGDAITAMALRLRGLLSGRGSSTIYGLFRDPAMVDEVRPVTELPGHEHPSWRRRVLVVHASTGHEFLDHVLTARRDRMVLVWHNVTPPAFLAEVDPAAAAALALGLAQVRAARGRWSACLADSEFNAAVLRDMGYGDVVVLPAGLDVHRLARLTPDPATLARWQGDGPLVLAVGQLLPHKRPDLVVEAVARLRAGRFPSARLALVGHARLPALVDGLHRQLAAAGLGRDALVGVVDDAQLAALYARADVFVSASEHEGLGIPPLEALAAGVPVVARGAGALPEVLGDAAVLVDPDAGAAGLGGALAQLLAEPERRASLAAAASGVLAGLDPDRLDQDFLRIVERVARGVAD